MEMNAGPLLSKIVYPSDLKKLKITELEQLCKELRQFIIDCVSINGGHFSASLGVVELTVALHYVFDTPEDKLVWDVGHQAYGHKILTGRREQFHTNRKYKGLSGFPKIAESEYDAFGVGHSSTSISAALGIAIAAKQEGNTKRQHIAIIGDGSMTAGLPFEALNHAGVSGANILVVLNDNNMAIDPNVGALKNYLTDITTSSTYNKIREDLWKVLGKVPMGREVASKVEASMKGMISKSSNLFEALNFRYFGDTDGHNVVRLVEILRDLKEIPGPKILHVKTIKGKGFELAEKDQTKWHAPGLFDKYTGHILKPKNTSPKPPKYQDVFGWTMIELAEKNPKIMGITPAMPSGSSLKYMMEVMPDRAIDVGIAEQHAVTLSAGLATQGMKVFCNIYSSFMQRGYDMVIHDVALQKLPVIFCLDRAGLVGDDGPTHHGCYDIAYMRCVPNLIVAAPINEHELRNMMFTAQLDDMKMPISIRYPRGEGVMIDWKNNFEKTEIGKSKQINEGKDIAILSFGHPGNFVIEANKILGEQSVAHWDMRYAKPLDEEALHHICKNYKYLITVEDGTVVGGFGSAILEFMAKNNYLLPLKMLGIPDEIIEHGPPAQLQHDCGYDTAGILNAIHKAKEVLSKENALGSII